MYALVIGRAYPQPKTGMMGIFEFEQAVALRNHGLKTVYAFCDTRSIKSLRNFNYFNIVSNDVPVYGYHVPIGGMPRTLFEKLKQNYNKKILKKIIKNHGIPDIIHVHFPLLNLTDGLWELLKKLNVPMVITEHWTKVQTKKIEPFRVDLLKRIVNESDTFICVGEPLKKSVIELTKTDKDIKVIPNMVKPNFYYENQNNLDKTFDFITIGRLVEVKRFGFAIDAFTKVFKDNQNIRLHIVGDGILFNKLKMKINDLGMESRIIMHGFLSREETSNLLKRSDVFLSASVLETFGVPFIEAMACGKPVIGITNGPIDKYIDDSNGVLFQQDNYEDLKRALIKVYENRSLYNGEQISKEAMKIFSEKAVAERIKEQFSELLNNI